MTFGVNINHLSQGLENGFIYPNNLKILPKTATPIIYNVIDATTIVNLLNIMTTPTGKKVFIGTIKFSFTPVNDSRSFQLRDPDGNYSFYFTDALPQNGTREQFLTMPMIFVGIDSTLTCKYSLLIFGYLFDYSLNP